MFNFPNIEKDPSFRYNQNFLKTVIFQIKYPKNNSITSNEKFLDETFKGEFPNKRNIMSGELKMKFEKTPILLSQTNAATGFEYKSNTGNVVYSVVDDAINLTFAGSEYYNFENSYSLYAKHVKTILDQINIPYLTRIAIRKINIFEFEYNDSTPLVNFLPFIIKEPAIENYFCFPNIAKATSGITQLSFNESDYQLNLAYGLLKDKSATGKNLAVIDIDLFKMGNIDTKLLDDEMRKINSEIFNVFEFLISENLKKLLNNKGTNHVNN